MIIMKKTITLLFFITTFAVVFAQQNYILDNERTLNTEGSITETDSETAWLTDSIYSYLNENDVYNLNQKTFFLYDEKGNNIQSQYEFWDSGSSSWNLSRYILTYDENGNLLQDTLYSWDSETSSWTVSAVFLYSYNESGNLIELIGKSWDSGTNTWTNLYKNTDYSYDADDKLLELITYSWDPQINSWSLSGKTTYSYNTGGLLIEDLHQMWISGTSSWRNVSRYYNFSYNTEGLKTEKTRQTWNTETNVWENFLIRTYEYDLNNTTSQTSVKMWDSENSLWIDTYLDDFYVSEHLTISVSSIEKMVLSVYPNPVKDILYLNFSTNIKQLNVFIISVSGKIIKSFSSNENNFNIAELPPGIYFLKIHSSEGTFIKKFVKK